MDLRLLVRGLWDRIGGWALVGLGALALLLGWRGVSETPLTSEQIPYVVSGGMFGIALIGTGATLLISSDLRDEWRKLDEIEEALRRLAGEDAAAPADTAVGRRGRDPGPRHAARARDESLRADS